MLFESFFRIYCLNQLDSFIFLIEFQLDIVGAISAQHIHLYRSGALFGHDPLILREKVASSGASLAQENCRSFELNSFWIKFVNRDLVSLFSIISASHENNVKYSGLKLVNLDSYVRIALFDVQNVFFDCLPSVFICIEPV